jgi:hypothetical protein
MPLCVHWPTQRQRHGHPMLCLGSIRIFFFLLILIFFFLLIPFRENSFCTITQPQQLSVFIHHQLVFPVFNQSRPPFDLAAADAAAAAAARRARRRRPPAPPPDSGPAPGGDSPPASFTRSHISLFILPAAPQRETSVQGPCREFDIVYR